MKNPNYNIKEEDATWYIGRLIDVADTHQAVLKMHEEDVTRLIKNIRRTNKRTRANTILSVAAISYVFLSARTILYLDRKVNNLKRDFMSSMNRREGRRDNTEGK